MLFPTPFDKKNISSLSFRCGTRCLKTLPPAIPVCAWPRFHVHLDNSELWCPAGCCKELRARRQGCLEWRVGSRHVACSEDCCAADESIGDFIARSEERSAIGGTHRKFERGARSSSEQRAGPVRCCARLRKDQWMRFGERKRGSLR